MNSYKKLSLQLLIVMILIALFTWGIHRGVICYPAMSRSR